MNDMKIGKKSLNSIALEKQKQNLGTPTIPVSRNATVFQFPDLSTSSNTTNIKSEPSVEATKVVQALTFSDEKPNNNTAEHLYATVNKPKNGQNGQNGQKSSLTTAESNSLKHTLPQHPYESHKNLSLQNFPPPPQQQQKQQNPQLQYFTQQNVSQPNFQIQNLPQQALPLQNMPQDKMPVQNLPMMIWPPRPLQQQQLIPPNSRPMFQQNQSTAMIQNVPRLHHPQCNSMRGLRPPQGSPSMTQSYPGPNILQPQKVDPQVSNANKTEQHIDKEFLAELEKNLGLSEASANLMPPSPAHTSNNTSVQKSNVPALLPPPQSSNRRDSSRRSQSTVRTCSASPSIHPPKRDDSLTRYSNGKLDADFDTLAAVSIAKILSE